MGRIKKKMVSVRGRAEHIDGARFRFICPKGHVHIKDMAAKSIPAPKRLGPNGVALMKRWWESGVTFECPGCTKEAAA